MQQKRKKSVKSFGSYKKVFNFAPEKQKLCEHIVKNK